MIQDISNIDIWNTHLAQRLISKPLRGRQRCARGHFFPAEEGVGREWVGLWLPKACWVKALSIMTSIEIN